MTKAQVNVLGIEPAASGSDSNYGDWFLIDQPGDFSLDHSVTATIWLVGGGCDGTAGVWNGNDVDVELEPIINTGTEDSYSGAGGDGGYVTAVMNVSIPKNQTLSAVIADRNDKSGTSLSFAGEIFRCNQSGSISRSGGMPGSIPTAVVGEQWADQNLAVLSGSGSDGVETPYGYVGSSGGGGAVCNGISTADNGIKGGNGAGSGTNHRGSGTDAENYGCGGGGGAVCGRIAEGQAGGKGKQGCIIIAYKVEEKTLVVQRHYKKNVTVKRNCTTNYAISSSRGGCGCWSEDSRNSNRGYTDSINVGASSEVLNDRVDELNKEIRELDEENEKLLTMVGDKQVIVDNLSGN